MEVLSVEALADAGMERSPVAEMTTAPAPGATRRRAVVGGVVIRQDFRK